MRGIRTRLALALVALVALTVTAIGVGTYLFVEARLRDGLLADAERQAQFNLSVLVPERLPAGVTRESYAPSGLKEAFRLRGGVETIVDYRDGALPDSSSPLNLPGDVIGQLPQAAPRSRRGRPARLRVAAVAGRGSLVVGGRYGGRAARTSTSSFPRRRSRLRWSSSGVGLVVAALIAVVLALATAGFIARGILRPVSLGSRAAARIAGGDLSARVPAGGADEFARFAAEFNRMADSLASTVARLERSESQNRRFVADVSHELRTPLTALVAEASIIEAGLADLPPDARRAGELLVADVRRLRVLVDDLMELSRFDARAERAELQPVDLVATVRSGGDPRLAVHAAPGRLLRERRVADLRGAPHHRLCVARRLAYPATVGLVRAGVRHARVRTVPSRRRHEHTCARTLGVPAIRAGHWPGAHAGTIFNRGGAGRGDPVRWASTLVFVTLSVSRRAPGRQLRLDRLELAPLVLHAVVAVVQEKVDRPVQGSDRLDRVPDHQVDH